MPARHYDVIVLGRSIGALLTAALLARRELRVLVLGQGQPAPVYRVEGHTLCRRTFSLLSASSPVFRRILVELAQTQNFRRLIAPLDPMFAYLDDDVRFEIPPDVELFGREIQREFPEIQQSLAELYAQVSADNAQIDQAFDRDLVWPPGTFFERLETGRIASSLPPSGPRSPASGLLERLPHGHKFRQVVETPALFASHSGVDTSALSELSLTRLHGSWTRGVQSLSRGEQELEEFLVARIVAHGGVVQFERSAERIAVKRGRFAGVVEQGEETVTAAEAIISSESGEHLAALSEGHGISKRARDHWPHVNVVGGRFVVSVIVDNAGVPAAFPREAFLIGNHPALPDLHVQRYDSHILSGNAADAQRTLLVAEMLLPNVSGYHLLGARHAVLGTLRRYLPFIDRHLVLVDSPHDGLPADLISRQSDGTLDHRQIERAFIKGVAPSTEPMQPRFWVQTGSYLSLAGEPLRGP
ncbi:MAG TPA: phytoene dehydrogenase, partial [Polyangiaceae bacterium]|nr:phytoene dehydrogenase [Polyangiaceae bacterium]